MDFSQSLIKAHPACSDNKASPMDFHPPPLKPLLMNLILLAVGVQHSSSYHMESLHRCSLRLLPISLAEKCFKPTTLPPIFRFTRMLVPKPEFMNPNPHFTTRKSLSSSHTAKAGWLLGMGEKKKTSLPDIVKAGDPVLHEPAREVDPKEIGSERIQKIIDDMVKVMRMAPGVGLAAPQIGIPLRAGFSVSLCFFF